MLPDVPAVKLIAGAVGLTPEFPKLKPPATQIAIQSKQYMVFGNGPEYNGNQVVVCV